MRSLLLAALLAAAPALAQTAPPSAADSALVERYVELTRDGLSTATSMLADAPAPLRSMMGAGSGASLDSIRAAFYADLRPALLAEAVDFMQGPVFERAQRASLLAADSLSFAEIQALLADPGDRPLADSALSAHYAAAFMSATQSPEIQERALEVVVGALPAEMLDAMGGADAFREMYRSQMASPQIQDLQADVMTRSARLSLAGLDEGEVRALIAFYESDAALYTLRTATMGSTNALASQMTEMMESMLAAPSPETGAAPPPPRPAAPGAGRVQPEIVGGPDALYERVVYPEEARDAGIEGRVLVQFVVDEGGAVTEAHVLQSPDPRLSSAALDAVRGVRFTPGRENGQPVRVQLTLPIAFSLGEEGSDGGGADGGR